MQPQLTNSVDLQSNQTHHGPGYRNQFVPMIQTDGQRNIVDQPTMGWGDCSIVLVRYFTLNMMATYCLIKTIGSKQRNKEGILTLLIVWLVSDILIYVYDIYRLKVNRKYATFKQFNLHLSQLLNIYFVKCEIQLLTITSIPLIVVVLAETYFYRRQKPTMLFQILRWINSTVKIFLLVLYLQVLARIDLQIDWKWDYVIWPFWVVFVILFGFSVAMIEFCVVRSTSGELTKVQSRGCIFMIVCAITFMLQSAMMVFGYIRANTKILVINMITSPIVLLAILVGSFLHRNELIQFLEYISTYPIAVAPAESKEVVEQHRPRKLPKFLHRISQTFFEPLKHDRHHTISHILPQKGCSPIQTDGASEPPNDFASPIEKQGCRTQMIWSEVPDLYAIPPQQCIICYDVNADAVFMDCGHGGTCFRCAEKVQKESSQCPVCRKPVFAIVLIDNGKENPKVVQILRTRFS